MKLKARHWAIAITLSASAHVVLFASAETAHAPSSERSAGAPAAVWGMSASSMTDVAEPVEHEPVEPKPLEDPGELEKLTELKEPEARPEALSDVTPNVVDEAKIQEERPVEVLEPVRKKNRPKPKEKKRVTSVGGPVGRAAGNAGRTSSSSSGASVSNYSSRVLSHLRRYKRHPGGRARGTVRMVFVLGPNGSVRSAKITGGSGSPALNKAALAMVRRAAPFPSFPSGIGKPSLTFSVPVRFAP